MKKIFVLALIIFTSFAFRSTLAGTSLRFTKQWTFNHEAVALGQVSEIPAFDKSTNTLWVGGVVGVDVLDAETGMLVKHIDLTSYGFVNSLAIHNGLAAFAIGSVTRTDPGLVLFYDTRSILPSTGFNPVMVGSLPDMLTFSDDGSKLLVANEATPSVYGARIGTTVPRIFSAPTLDPEGSVSIIDTATQTVTATSGFNGVDVIGGNIRTNPGMDFEPEYIAVNKEGNKAYVTLQEANALGVLNLKTNAFERVIGLGVKDFSLPGNEIDPLNDSTINFISPQVKGFYMPDGIADYQWRGKTFLVMANEGDFREDDGDRSAASTLGAALPLANLRISNTESTSENLLAAGARSFSIRDQNGKIIFDSGSMLDMKAVEFGIYDDNRSRDKGVEPEGVALLKIVDRVYAFIGLERTLKSSVAVFDITNPNKVNFIDMIVTNGDVAPEGLVAYQYQGEHFLAISNETSKTTTLYRIGIKINGI
jgi:DNA-binding beta-propeller fold protein YncE